MVTSTLCRELSFGKHLVAAGAEVEQFPLPRLCAKVGVGHSRWEGGHQAQLTTQGQLQARLHTFDPRSQHPRGVHQEYQWPLTHLCRQRSQ